MYMEIPPPYHLEDTLTGNHKRRGEGKQPQRLVCRIPGSRQAQCTSRRDFAPFTSSTHRAFHGEPAGKIDGRGLAGGWEVRSARTHNTNCINKKYRRAQGLCTWSPPKGGAGDQSSSAHRGLPSKRTRNPTSLSLRRSSDGKSLTAGFGPKTYICTRLYFRPNGTSDT
jgi:hypothetical protein